MPVKLSGLELQGYKTFANKNTFEFSDGITAIVGPNGSGKSNVADAIRWVLGEQSFSLLRARKTDDMIFSGSERRPRAGMASATITFDNETQWLPIDYTEVSITRRAYRDGQNEYLLNGTRVRLREINELLARSGLAERTYTVIGQGLVDSALSLRPEERRSFFEEAAGIQLYRSRQQEADNRLTTTRRNMDRVYDILNEIKPRLRSLERQARKVEEADRITADLQLLLREWYGYHWHASQREIQQAQEIYQTRNEVLTNAREKQMVVEKQLQTARDQIRELRQQLSIWHGESSRYHSARESESKEAAVLEERKKSMFQQEGELNRQRGELSEQLELNQERLTRSLSELETRSAEFTETQEKAKAIRARLEERMHERKALADAIQTKRDEIYSIDVAELQAKTQKNELSQRIGEYEVSIEEHKGELEVLETQLDAQVKLRQKLTNERAAIGQKRSELRTMIEEQMVRLKQQRGAISELQQLLNEKRIQRTTAEASLRYLEDAETSFTGLSAGSANLLQTSQKGRFSGEISALSSHLDVPEAYERAVAAYLGERIHAVLVESDSSLEDILKYLASGSFERTVLATPKKTSSTTSQWSGEPGVLGAMSTQVNFPKKFDRIFTALFSNVLIVKDRVTARALMKKDVNCTLVTTAGEIFYPDGVVVAGVETTKSGIISRPREKRELGTKIKGFTADEGKLSTEIASSEQKLTASQKILHDLEVDLEQQETSFSIIERELFQQNLIAERYENDIAAGKKRIEELQTRIASSVGLIEGLDKKINGFAELRKTADIAIATAQKTLLNLPVEELQNDVNHWETNTAVLQQSVENYRLRVEEARSRAEQSKAQINLIEQRLVHHAKEFEEVVEQQHNLLSQEHEMIAKIETITAKIRPAEEQLRVREEALVNLQEEFTNVQQALTVADRNATQAQLNLTREREKLDLLREKIEDDLGLVAFEYEQRIAGQETLPLEGLVKQLPMVKELSAGLDSEIKRNRAMLRRLGAINPEAKNEYDEVFERHEFLTQQLADLSAAEEDLKEVISELNELMKVEFNRTFEAVAAEFKVFFTRLFNGGSARLELTDAENPTETGIEIHAKLPGRREQSLALLSGGERSLTAVALVFSLLKVSPTPFCILDEVDAMLDESNVGRFCDLLKEIGTLGTQFIVITHNRGTVQAADIIYGVTKGTDSASHVVSLKLDEVSDDMVYA
ncbi:MAG: chromosome segregation protein SMC [Anaerolineae bacterium]|jgi:chromosome segregation protein|nr:chromosome segregation protein SMC [Anaerolineae bacterium]